MPGTGASYGKIPRGNIEAASFVKLDTSNDFGCLQCGAGDRIYGISQVETRRIALDGYDTSLCGILGDPAIEIYGPASVTGVLLRLGGTVAAGDYLKSDASGFGVVADTNLDDYGARALCAGTSGKLVPVEILIGERSS